MRETKHIVLVHLFLNLYLLAMFQPLYPILEYVIHYDYIVEELCENRDKPVSDCHGKCYLGKQLVQEDTNSDQNPSPVPPSVDFDKLMTLKYAPFSFAFLNPDLRSQKPASYSQLLGIGSLHQVFRPPIL